MRIRRTHRSIVSLSSTDLHQFASMAETAVATVALLDLFGSGGVFNENGYNAPSILVL